MKKLLLLSSLIGCAHHKQATEKEIDLYCQDLNVLYQKQAVIEANRCFEKYPFVNEKHNYRKYLGR
jgi:hypothetical protein